MSIYPNGIASTGVYNIFQGTNFSPNDVVRAIRDNYSPVNRTTMLNSLGYQIGLIQNFVNSSYLGRPDVPVQNGYFASGWASGVFAAVSGTFGSYNYIYSALYPEYAKSARASFYDISHFIMTPDEISFSKQSAAVGLHLGSLSYSGLYLENINGMKTYIMNGSGTYGSPSQAVWKVTGTDSLFIGNDSSADYSGGFTLWGKNIDLYSTNGIYLQGPSASNRLSFCGNTLVISGGTNVSNVRFFNNILPTTDGERELGDSGYYWKDLYVTQMHSSFVGVGTSTFVTKVGGVCGAVSDTFSSEVYNAGGNLQSAVGLYPNKVYLRSTSYSGYLFINSGGQLEFNRIGTGGQVLTSF